MGNDNLNTDKALTLPHVDEVISDLKSSGLLSGSNNGLLSGSNNDETILKPFDIKPLAIPAAQPVDKPKAQRTC